MIKVLHIITGLSTGGAEMSLYRLLAKRSANYNHHVISLSTIGEVGTRIEELGISVEALEMRPGIPDPLAIFQLARKLKTLKPDLVHTWMYHADLIGGISARLAGVPAVMWGIRHSNLSPKLNKRATLAVVKVCSWLSNYIPDRILCCSEVARDIHIKVGYCADKFVVIPNGIDLARYKPDTLARESVRAELGLSENTPLIGIIARFDSQKNHEGFIRAAGLLHTQQPAVHFLLAGRNIDIKNADLDRWMKKAGLHEVCHLLGQRDDIPRLMAALDISTSTSSGEAFPNVVAEAMSCGVPCVVTDVGDSAYIVGDAGLVVNPGDMRELADAWEKLLSLLPDERRYLGERARARVAENFELGSIVVRYENLYEELLKSKYC